jgi:hypothetical protein
MDIIFCTKNLKYLVTLYLFAIIVGIPYSTLSFTASHAYAKIIGNPLVYHLSSDEPWRATVALSDATTMLKLGHNVTLLLSIEGVQLGAI